MTIPYMCSTKNKMARYLKAGALVSRSAPEASSTSAPKRHRCSPAKMKGTFVLGPEDDAALLAAIAEADVGRDVSAAEVLQKIRRR